MNRHELTLMLGALESPAAIAQWLRTTYLPALINHFNTDDVRKRLGLYLGERIPDNESNLTDVRTRVSLIIEYELARLSNQMLADAGETELFWSYVIANRFPDLEVRRSDGTRYLRIEVKCLQSIAEEKSANFDTLKKDLNPTTDFVVVFLWDWAYQDSQTFLWDQAPVLLKCYVFHASSLAELRDICWLNQPPPKLGNGYQGFDLRYAVNCKEGIYSEEEGNYGKLLRIWKKDFPYRPPSTDVLLDTESEYLHFKQDVVMAGFWSLCEYHLPRLSEQRQVERISWNGQLVGAKSGKFGFFVKALMSKNAELISLMQAHGLSYGLTMTEKYICSGFELSGSRSSKLFGGKKPKLLQRQLFGLP